MIDMLGYRERQGERTESWVVTGGFLGITHGQGGAFNVCSSCGSRVGVNVSVIEHVSLSARILDTAIATNPHRFALMLWRGWETNEVPGPR